LAWHYLHKCVHRLRLLVRTRWHYHLLLESVVERAPETGQCPLVRRRRVQRRVQAPNELVFKCCGAAAGFWHILLLLLLLDLLCHLSEHNSAQCVSTFGWRGHCCGWRCRRGRGGEPKFGGEHVEEEGHGQLAELLILAQGQLRVESGMDVGEGFGIFAFLIK
jgi:hypothetical protein